MIVEAGDNRVPEPTEGAFVVLTQMRQSRLRTNIDTDADCKFTASIAGTTMTVTAVDHGVISPGAVVFASGIATGTKVVSGPGGVGTYVVSTSQTLTSRTMSAGQTEIEQGQQMVIQIDFHDTGVEAGDAAAAFTTAFRDEYATGFFEALADTDAVYDGIAPLYADEGRLVPYTNENQQNEWRWVVEATLQANRVIALPTQYADSIEVTPVSVEASFPP
jgi:hypothetical protein